jgi:uncharacterized protein (TIGR00251 family)
LPIESLDRKSRALPADTPWRRDDAGAVILALHVQPGARRTEIAGLRGEGKETRLRIRLAAPPVDGKANAELKRFLADAFDVPLRDVVLVRGETSRQKVVRIERPTRRPDLTWQTEAVR